MIRTLVTVFAALGAAIPAQLTSRVETRTDYGALATSGHATDFDAVAAHTAVGSGGLVVSASLGGTRDLDYSAATRVTLESRNLGVAGVQVSEVGAALARDTHAMGSAGTSPSHPSATPAFGPHAVSLHVDVRAGTRCRVSIAWSGAASTGASVRTAVDVDGDQHPDFAAHAGSRVVQDLFVTAGAAGVVVDIETEGRALLAGAGHESYSASLRVDVTVDGGGGGGCTITPFGHECGGRLAGTATSSTREVSIAFDVSGAAPHAVGILVVGDLLPTPIPLPGSARHCELLVLPRLSAALPIDGSGAGRVVVRIPGGQQLDTNAQVVTLAVGTTIDLASTNGLNVVCR